MQHGIVDVFAFQEALLIEAAFGLIFLTMAWVGFRRWLQHKERERRLIAQDRAELAAQFGAIIERVEARLITIEQGMTSEGTHASMKIEPPAGSGGGVDP